MDTQNKREKYTEYTVFATIAAVLLFIFSLFIALSASREADFSFKGIQWLFRNNPASWIIIAFTLLFPASVFFISKRFVIKLEEKQTIIDKEQSRIEHVMEFNHQLTHGNFNVDCKLEDNDALGDTLVDLRETLKTNEDNSQKIRKAEEERNWIADGLAHFSEILRNYIHEPEQLSFHVIKDLTKYVNAVQGGFYVLDDSDSYNRFFNLNAFFAYDRRKFADQKIKWGDGLIGTCALEKKTIYLKNVPQEYITVTSGLGEANPESLIVVPMIYEDEIYGVMEFASFSKFEPNHISLLEKTAESVGATLSAVKTNIRTARLLEESKAQTQILTSHEEEMRQNMEELQATQEESVRQTQRLVMLEDTLKKNIIQAEFDPQGLLLSGNQLFYSKFEYSSDLRIEGKDLKELIDEDYREEFARIWSECLSNGIPYKGYLKHVTRTGKELWSMASLSTILYDDNSVSRVMYLGIDATEERRQLEKHEVIADSVKASGISLSLDINGNILDCNKNFTDLVKISQKEARSMVIFDLINPVETESFNRHWDTIINGNAHTGIIKAKSSKGDDLWLKGTFNVTHNASHETENILFTGQDITHEKHLEAELHTALDTLKKQEKQIREAEKELGNKLRETRNELMAQYKEVEKAKNLNEKILEEIADAVVTTAHDNRIVFFNKAAEKLWGTKRDEVVNQDVSILFPEILTEKDEILGSFTRPGEQKITGIRRKSHIIDKNGKERHVSVMLTKARAEGENAYMAIFQITDK
ncbi:MAG TPA: PAS domain S-box protein [Bacteroidales bacterium]|nr:PAS domain S-box protein [Bacteroidales bacterium]